MVIEDLFYPERLLARSGDVSQQSQLPHCAVVFDLLSVATGIRTAGYVRLILRIVKNIRRPFKCKNFN